MTQAQGIISNHRKPTVIHRAPTTLFTDTTLAPEMIPLYVNGEKEKRRGEKGEEKES